MQPEEKADVERAIREALTLYGVTGSVVLAGRFVELHGAGAPVAIDVELLGDQWALLPPDIRMRRAGEIARRLAEAHRAGGNAQATVAAPGGAPARVVILPLGGLAAVLAVAVLAYFALRSSSNDKPAPVPVASSSDVAGNESDADAKARKARVCEATRKRFYAGASIGPFDVDGWVLELWLAKKSKSAPGDDPKLQALVANDKVAAAADSDIAKIGNARVELVDGFAEGEAAKSPAWRATTLRFTGNYVGAFLEVDGRAHFLVAADKLATAGGAELAALYGRCADLAARDLGGWFRGSDAPHATTALVYAMGFFTENPIIDKIHLKAIASRGELDGLLAASSKIDKPVLAKTVAVAAGQIAESESDVAITFPLGGPTLATQAAKVAAKRIGVGLAD